MSGVKRKIIRCRSLATALVLASMLVGCANFKPLPPNTYATPPNGSQTNETTIVGKNNEAAEGQPLKPGQYVRFDESIRSAPLLHAAKTNTAVDKALGLPNEPVKLNADELPVNHFINLALGDVLGVNYIVDNDLSENTSPITLRVNKSVTPVRMLGLVEEVLQVNGIALVREDDLIKVIPAAKTDNQTPELLNQSVEPMLRYGKVAQIMPIYYLSINQASSMVSKLLREGSGGTVLVQTHLNSLMVVAQQKEIKRVENLLAKLDVPSKSASHMALATPRYKTASELSKSLKAALDAASIPTSIGRGTHGVILTPVNSEQLLISSSTKAWLRVAQEWLKRLDIPEKIEGKNGVYAYYMKNTKASDAWNVVSTIFGGKEAKNGNTQKAAQQNIVESASGNGVTPGNVGFQRLGSNTAGAMSVVDKNFRVVIDNKRNAIIFQGQYTDYQRLIELLKFVDQRPRQVLLQATVAEVKVEDGYSFGTEFNTDQGDVTGGTNGLIQTAGNLTLNGVFGDFTAKFSAALDSGKAQVLSSPRIIAMDQQPARINIGEQIQVKTGEVSGGGDDSTATITYQYVDVGITLDITPTINQNGLVELILSQEVSSQGVKSGDSIPINRRSLQTQLLADSGDTVYMGGLISKDNNSSKKKVPLLGDIPLLGGLFSYTEESQNSTELVLLITPYVISSRDEAQFYTKEFKSLTGWELAQSLPQ
ncbi:secretin N-terminal domain-containing protein [Salinivibrio sp. ES.052]|uniref:secretin N-terminal domain-containing protein n=1 Tax=Salinivibrio sp. ES.052 TaxID=1882823 RepID=UPI000929ABB4|nr:secretin N-terminal domain-containing protein [Salinivibrio sp. ES.052]SIN79617.1 general secretion pathway protein D [Salinivibrio sp. ES.052]